MGESTHAVMTGGDFALIRSVESFEDYISFGYHQMEQAGVREGDVVVAISEGGETSSVIGTVLRGVDAKAKVFFLFNNPAELLAAKLERCRRVIENPAVTTIVLCTGPMGVAGSTRMQATTIEMLVAGAAFEAGLTEHLKGRLSAAQCASLGLGFWTPERTLSQFEALLSQLRTDANLAAMARMTDREADIYSKKGRVTYFANAYLLDIFTDTTDARPHSRSRLSAVRRYHRRSWRCGAIAADDRSVATFDRPHVELSRVVGRYVRNSRLLTSSSRIRRRLGQNHTPYLSARPRFAH